MRYLLFYEKTLDHAEREKPLMAAHRKHLDAAVRRGDLVLGGSLSQPTDGAAVLLFQAGAAAVAEEFARADPYVVDGLVNRWTVRPWDIVVGTGVLSLHE